MLPLGLKTADSLPHWATVFSPVCSKCSFPNVRTRFAAVPPDSYSIDKDSLSEH